MTVKSSNQADKRDKDLKKETEVVVTFNTDIMDFGSE